MLCFPFYVPSQDEYSISFWFGNDVGKDLAFTIDDSVEVIDLLLPILFLFKGDGLERDTFIGVFIIALRFIALAFLWQASFALSTSREKSKSKENIVDAYV